MYQGAMYQGVPAIQVVFIILEDVLTVDASKHHMVDACSAFLPNLPRHVISSYSA